MNGKLKVVLVQSNPIYKNITKNIQILNDMLKSLSEKDKIDIVLFTEMALTGYFFDSKEDIEPYTSYCEKGETFDFCSNISKKLKCYTFLGFPEKEGNNFYNSLMITDREGKLIKSYHKKNLFKDDKKWCTPGKEFEYIDIMTISGKTARLALGICLDYYYSSIGEFNFEYANFFCNKNINFFIFPTNWADRQHEDNSEKNIFSSINKNWLYPLKPIFREGNSRNIYLLAADRTGIERNVYLLGCSCIVKLKDSCEVLDYLDKNINDIIIKELEY